MTKSYFSYLIFIYQWDLWNNLLFFLWGRVYFYIDVLFQANIKNLFRKFSLYPYLKRVNVTFWIVWLISDYINECDWESIIISWISKKSTKSKYCVDLPQILALLWIMLNNKGLMKYLIYLKTANIKKTEINLVNQRCIDLKITCYITPSNKCHKREETHR